MNPFVRDALARALRNAVQVLVPFLALTSSGSITGTDTLNAGAAAGLAGVLSLLKTAAGFKAPATASLAVQVAERALGAAAGAVVAIWPLTLAGSVSADWSAIGVTAVSAACLSILTWVLEYTPVDPAGVDGIGNAG